MQQLKTMLLNKAIDQSWSKIPPLWPLANSIAVSPLQGLEHLSFESAITEASIYFQQREIPNELNAVNCQTIKWMQAFFDKGQATVAMPLRVNGLYLSLRALMPFDKELFLGSDEKQQWLKSLPLDAGEVILDVLDRLNISESDYADFLTLSLTTLPGWASCVKYLAWWSGNTNIESSRLIEREYLAIRLIIIYLLWPKAVSLLAWHAQNKVSNFNDNLYSKMILAEQSYQKSLLEKFKKELKDLDLKPSCSKVQMVFCIDVRAEPFRRAIETVGDYETLGFAGFFGLPLRIDSAVTSESYDSCPVLLSAKNRVQEISNDSRRLDFFEDIQRLYQSMKHAFTVPFLLVEVLGLFMGFAMALKTIVPRFLGYVQRKLLNGDKGSVQSCFDISSMSFADQCEYAKTVLSMLGLTKDLKKLVVFCGHGSTSKNNPYAASLDCGACGGRHGGSNARILAMILNSLAVREFLKNKGIDIPSETIFVGAEHNTTTDDLFLYESDVVDFDALKILNQLKLDLALAREKNSLYRARLMGYLGKDADATSHVEKRSQDWAQVRPEWGLAGNASFIVAPRSVTKNIDLGGRSFLHSYDYSSDLDASFLTTILTAPMIVAQWINYQYLFSAIDNVAYGSGSKTTQNVTGKIGIMQGNASDLMLGLPWQSLYISETNSYHEPMRLQVFVYGPRAMLDKVIGANDLLQKLFGNGWVILICIEPIEHNFYALNRDFSWKKIED